VTGPNFFVVGAPKAGTTSLYHYLDQHPEIFMSPIKEPSFLADEMRPENFEPELQPQVLREIEEARRYLRGPMKHKRFGGPVVVWADYLRLFENSHGAKAVGEASVSYLWSQSAANNIFARFPLARIVIMLRDPADRAFSQYLQALSAGRVHHSFRQQLEISLKDERPEFGILRPLLEYGRYSEQVRRYLDLFPRESVKVYLYDDFRQDPKGVVDDLFVFLGVASGFAPDFSRRHHQPSVPKYARAAYYLKRHGVWQTLKRATPAALHPHLRSAATNHRSTVKMDGDDRRALQNYYRQDIVCLSQMIGRDLSMWLE
jgi:sulfotransferase family protein